MNKNDFNSGKFSTSREQKSRYVTSTKANESKKWSIILIASILLSAIVTVVLFMALAPDSLLAWNPFGDGNASTTPTKNTIPKPTDPNKNYPYTTVTDKTQFVASQGGQGMYNLDVNSDYAILVRLSDMSTIGYKDADESIYPASMTKLMTVIVALDLIENLDDVYIFEPSVLDVLSGEESTADMKYIYNEYIDDGDFECQKYTARDLLYGVSYRSGADSVVCLVDYLGLEMDEFVALMNSKANEIGLENTRFGGAIGMDSENNTTTCRDMAAIMAYAMENPLCAEIFGGVSYRLNHIMMTYYNSTLHKTLNNMGTTPQKVLGSKYTIVATKSGLEDKAGYCLVSCIKNNETGELFVLVTAKAEKAATYPVNKTPILDMQEIFGELNP